MTIEQMKAHLTLCGWVPINSSLSDDWWGVWKAGLLVYARHGQAAASTEYDRDIFASPTLCREWTADIERCLESIINVIQEEEL